MSEAYTELRAELQDLPHISPAQVEQWVNLQETIDKSRDYLVLAVPEAQASVEQAQRILEQRTYTLVFFGGTGVGKSTLINALLGRNLLPTGAVTAVTGTIVYIEQAEPGTHETLTLEYWPKDEFASRVKRLCELAELPPFDIIDSGEREQARFEIESILEANRESAKTGRDEYLEILLDCIASYDANKELYKIDAPPPQVFEIDNDDALTHLREDGFKGTGKRQIRLIRSATFRVHPVQKEGVPNLFMNGYLRIVDVPGLGAGMRLHEEITLEEMKKQDAMIVLVSDAGRQRVDEMKSLSAVHWVKDNRLFGLRGSDLDEASAKIFMVINGANVRQAYDRLMSGAEAAELEVKEVTRHLAPNYWQRYSERGNGRPYFFVMPPVALYLQDPEHSPHEFESETERIMKAFRDKLGGIDPETNPLEDDEARAQLMALSEVPQLRAELVKFIQNERVRGQLREASTRVRQAIGGLRRHYESELAQRGVYPPFDTSWESLQQRRYESLLNRLQKELPRAFHAALVDMSQRTNSESRFRSLLAPSLNSVKNMVQDSIKLEIETLLDSYGTEYWDDRDVTYDNLVWGTSGIELPIKRILYQVELMMQQAVSQFMPSIADVVVNELQRTLEEHEITNRLLRAEYGQGYTYTLASRPGEALDVSTAVDELLKQIEYNFRQVCRHATMYELVKPGRSVHQQLEASDELGLASNERILDIALEGRAEVERELARQAAASNNTPRASAPAPQPAAEEEEFVINILDQGTPSATGGGSDDISISFPMDDPNAVAVRGYEVELEQSYADKLDTVAEKTNKIFGRIVDDLFSDQELLPRLRRLFWMEATRAEQEFNNQIIKPMLRNHDRNLYSEELQAAMAIDLESVSDIEAMMRIWEGLHELEGGLLV